MDVVVMRGRNLDAPQLPVSYSAARRALSKCADIDECRDWKNKAEALRSYARQAQDSELEKCCARIKVRATQRMGELLKEINAKGKRTDQPGGGDPTKLSQREAAESAGLSKDQQVQAVRVANVPHDEFERLVESDDPPTVTAMAERGTRVMKRRSHDEVLMGIFEDVMCVRIEFLDELLPDLSIPPLTQKQVDKALKQIKIGMSALSKLKKKIAAGTPSKILHTDDRRTLSDIKGKRPHRTAIMTYLDDDGTPAVWVKAKEVGPDHYMQDGSFHAHKGFKVSHVGCTMGWRRTDEVSAKGKRLNLDERGTAS